MHHRAEYPRKSDRGPDTATNLATLGTVRFALAKHRCAQVPLRIRLYAARRKLIARLRKVIGLGANLR